MQSFNNRMVGTNVAITAVLSLSYHFIYASAIYFLYVGLMMKRGGSSIQGIGRFPIELDN
jgi:hypothetical protein